MTLTHPLMEDNISRENLDDLIAYLSTDNPRLTNGPKVAEFENAWSSWLGVRGSVMVNSGSSANELTMQIVESLKGRGEVIVPPLTWVSDIASVIKAGLRPVFVDISLDTLGLSEEGITNRLSSATRAVFLTHILGLNALTNGIMRVIEGSEAELIEDCCESHGALYCGEKVGSHGWISNFSFYYAHHISTIEGGAISSNDEEVLEQARLRRSHGMVREASSEEIRNRYKLDNPELNPDFIFAYAAQNVRPTEIQGVLGLSQLQHLDSAIETRRKNFSTFLDALDPDRFYTHFDRVESSNYALIVVLRDADFELRDDIETRMRRAGIEFRRGLSGGGNQLRQPYLADLAKDYRLSDFPNTEHVHHFGWYVGNYPSLTNSQLENLIDVLNR